MNKIATGTKSWNCIKKQDARDACVIRAFRSLYNLESIPKGHQYWTMPGICASNGKIIVDSEYHQLIKSKLLKPSQFYSVDLDKKVYVQNCRLNGGNWIYGDFVDTLYRYYREDHFKPSIINFDATQTPKKISHNFGKILHLLNLMKEKKTLVVVTSMYKNRWHTSEEPFEDLLSTHLALSAFNEGWYVSNYYYYKREKSRCNMVMLCFYK